MTQLCESQGSISKLLNNQWKRVAKGKLILLYNKFHDTQPVMIKVIGNNTNNIHTFQSKPKAKVKGTNSLILKAIYTKTNKEYIIVIRIKFNESLLLFQSKIQNVSKRSQSFKLKNNATIKYMYSQHVWNCSLCDYKNEPSASQSNCTVCKSPRATDELQNHQKGSNPNSNTIDLWNDSEGHTLSINEILSNITQNICTSGITADMMSDILLLTHNNCMQSSTLLNTLLKKCNDASIEFRARRRAIKMCETWINAYWIDFELNSNTLTIMDLLIEDIDTIGGNEQFYNWFDQCINDIEFGIKIIDLVTAFIITSQNDYFPTELVSLIIAYIDKHSILMYRLKSMYIKQKLNNNSGSTERKQTNIDIPTDYDVIRDEQAQIIAEQLTFMHFEIFKCIGKKEFIDQAWKKKDRDTRAPNLIKLIKQFNTMLKWVQCVILVQKNKKQRLQVIEKCINICIHLKTLQNYSGCCAICFGLNSNAIYKLIMNAWNGVSKKLLKSYQEIKNIYSGKSSWRDLRILHSNAKSPAILHTGLFLQDLLSTDEGAQDYSHKINIRKLKRLYDFIHYIHQYQQSEYQEITPDYKIQESLKKDWEKQQLYDDEKLWKISKQVQKDMANENVYIDQRLFD